MSLDSYIYSYKLESALWLTLGSIGLPSKLQWDSQLITSLKTWFMMATWGPSGADRTQAGPMLAPWTLLSGISANRGVGSWDRLTFMMKIALLVRRHLYIETVTGMQIQITDTTARSHGRVTSDLHGLSEWMMIQKTYAYMWIGLPPVGICSIQS